MVIDWTRVAEPQPDQYDTEVALRRLARLKDLRSHRSQGGAPTFFDGAVEIRPLEGPYLQMEGFSSAPASDERIRLAESYVRQWPTAFQQFRGLMHSFYPLSDVTGTRIRPGSKGSISHSYQSQIGTMCASIEDPVCLAQAFVHEMAHNKLRALGIMVESAQDLIINDPKNLYSSPVRTDILRPMTAVFHAEYSFIYVTQLDLKMLAAEPDEELRNYLITLLKRNVSRMETGFKVILDNIQVDSNGRFFVDNFMDWAGRVIAEGLTILNGGQIPPGSVPSS